MFYWHWFVFHSNIVDCPNHLDNYCLPRITLYDFFRTVLQKLEKSTHPIITNNWSAKLLPSILYPITFLLMMSQAIKRGYNGLKATGKRCCHLRQLHQSEQSNRHTIWKTGRSLGLTLVISNGRKLRPENKLWCDQHDDSWHRSVVPWLPLLREYDFLVLQLWQCQLLGWGHKYGLVSCLQGGGRIRWTRKSPGWQWQIRRGSE